MFLGKFVSPSLGLGAGKLFLKQHRCLPRLASFTIIRTAASVRYASGDAAPPKSFDEIPGPGALPNIFHFIKKGGLKNLLEIQAEKFEKFGPIFKESFIGEKIVHICDADAVETITRSEGVFPSRGFDDLLDMLKDLPFYALLGNKDYEAWRAARSPIAPTFLRPMEIQKFASGVNSVAKAAVTRLRHVRNTELMVDKLKYEMDGYTTENILLLIYDARMGFHRSPQNPRVLEFMRVSYDFNDIFSKLMSGLNGMLKPYQYFATPTYKKLCHNKEELLHMGSKFAEVREKKRHERQNVCLYDKITAQEGKENFVESIAIALSQLGVETTSTTLLWCLHHLARNPEVQEKAYNEIVEVIGTSKDDKSIEYPQFFNHLPYIKGCIKESLRLSQVAVLHTRLLENDTILCGYKLPKNTSVGLWHLFLSQSADHFTSPEEFQPERWQRGGNHEKINPFAYVPFGFGVRMCLGRRFAELELVHGLAHIIQNFRLEYAEETVVKTVFGKGGLLQPDKELPIRFIDRM